MHSAVIDNSSLVYLTNLHAQGFPILKLLRNLFATLHFPQKVINEYMIGTKWEPNRQLFVDKIRPENKYFRLCTSYDSIIQAIVAGHKGIDAGEGEAYAQFRKVHANMIISDDKEFAKTMRSIDSTVKVYSSLHLLCWLQILGYITNWGQLLAAMQKVRPFNSPDLRQAYNEVMFMLGVDLPRKRVSELCSLSKWLHKE